MFSYNLSVYPFQGRHRAKLSSRQSARAVAESWNIRVHFFLFKCQKREKPNEAASDFVGIKSSADKKLNCLIAFPETNNKQIWKKH